MGTIYIMSNPVLPKMYKIGLTRGCPHKRAKDLSKSSAIPDDFKVIDSILIDDVDTAERRVHLLLLPNKYSAKKEFFCIPLEKAKLGIRKIAEYMRRSDVIPEFYSPSRDLVHRIHDLRLIEEKILAILMASTEGNSLIDRCLSLPHGVVSGFMSACMLADYLDITEAMAARHMINFCRSRKDYSIKFINDRMPMQVFEELRYYRRQMLWLFTTEFRSMFFTQPKCDAGGAAVKEKRNGEMMVLQGLEYLISAEGMAGTKI